MARRVHDGAPQIGAEDTWPSTGSTGTRDRPSTVTYCRGSVMTASRSGSGTGGRGRRRTPGRPLGRRAAGHTDRSATPPRPGRCSGGGRAGAGLSLGGRPRSGRGLRAVRRYEQRPGAGHTPPVAPPADRAPASTDGTGAAGGPHPRRGPLPTPTPPVRQSAPGDRRDGSRDQGPPHPAACHARGERTAHLPVSGASVHAVGTATPEPSQYCPSPLATTSSRTKGPSSGTS